MTLTLADIYSRCDEVGECMEWTGYCRDGRPLLWHTEERHWLSVRRRVIDLTRVKPLDTKRYHVVAKCRNDACVAADHLRVVGKAHWLTEAAKRRGPGYHAAHTSGNRRRSSIKLTLDVAREIRASTLSSRKEAELRDIAPSLVRAIRRNEVWREGVVPGASVFSL